MFNVSSEFKNAIKNDSREFKSKVLIGEEEYSDDKIINFSLESSMAPSDEFSLGAVVASKFQMSITLNDIRSNKLIKPFIGLKVGNTFEYVPLGVFNIEEKSTKNGLINLSCYDNIGKLEKPYFSDLSYPATLQSVATEICKKANVTFSSTLPNLKINKKIDGYTCREALSFIASACGGFTIANRTGAIEIKNITNSTSSITGNNYFTFENDDAFTIKKVTAHIDDKTRISRGTGIGIEEIEFKNPVANDSILDYVYSKIKDYKYIPGTLVWQGNPALDLGEKLTITDISGINHEILIMRNKIVYEGGLRGETNSLAKSLGKSNFNYGGSMQGAVDRVTAEQIVVKELLADKANIGQLNAINANIENLTVTKADIEDLTATNANIENLIATKANITDLNATNATITNLQATKADIVDLNAANGKITILESESAKIGVLEGNVAKIQDVVSGNISSDNIQSGGITGDRLNMSTIFVNDANIININASKVNAGEIDTSKVKVKSADGAIEIAGATQQFKDKNNKVRIQMGKDTQGNFNFILRGEDGTSTLIDHTGIKEKAITDNLIKDTMIAPDAVGEKQIDYNSFATGFNKDTNTSNLKATKVRLDNQNQTLDVAFTSLKNQADGTKTQTESNTTKINVANGKIETAIANTKIVKNGQEVLLKDDYNTTVATVDSMKNTISSHTTKIDTNTGKIGTVESKTNVLERDLNSMSSKISATESTVKTHTTQIDKNKKDIIAVNTEVSTTKNKISGIEQDINSITQRVGSVETTTTTHTATINSHTSSLNAVDGKINTVKIDVINSAAIDAQSKADKALNDGKGYTNIEVTKVVTSTTSKFAEIKTTTDSITNRVSNTEKTTTTLSGTVNNLTSPSAMPYQKNLIIYGDSNKYYPVYIMNGNQDILRTIKIWRSYSEQGPVDWNTSTHKGSLMLTWQGNFGGWGGATYKEYILENSSQYTVLLADCKLSVHSMGYTFFLRGGGTGGAIYHFGSDQGIDPKVFYNGTNDLVYDHANSSYDVTAFEPLTIVNTERLNNLKLAREASVTVVKNQVADIKITTDAISSRVSQVESTTNTINGKVTAHESRLTSAEQKITPNAIINTVQNTVNQAKNEAINSANSSTDGKLNSYVTKSVFTQTNDQFDFVLQNTGNENLFPNSSFENEEEFNKNHNFTLDRISGALSGYPKPFKDGYYLRLYSNGGDSYFVKKTAIGITPNTNYVFSVYYAASVNCNSSCYLTINGNLQHMKFSFIGDRVWRRAIFKFRTPANVDGINAIRIGAIFPNSQSWILFDDCQFERECLSPWKSHKDELYSGLTRIDRNGVNVFNGALSIFNNAKERVFYADNQGNLNISAVLNAPRVNGRLFSDNGIAITTPNVNNIVFHRSGGDNGYISQITQNNLFIGHYLEFEYGGGKQTIFHTTARPSVAAGGNIDLGSGGARWRNIYATNGTIQTSDRTEKKNINYINSHTKDQKEFDGNEFYDFIKQLNFATWEWNNESLNELNTNLGFIAQDIEASKIGNVILCKKEGVLGYSTSNYINVIGLALKESISKIEVLENNNKLLENRIENLEKVLNELGGLYGR